MFHPHHKQTFHSADIMQIPPSTNTLSGLLWKETPLSLTTLLAQKEDILRTIVSSTRTKWATLKRNFQKHDSTLCSYSDPPKSSFFLGIFSFFLEEAFLRSIWLLNSRQLVDARKWLYAAVAWASSIYFFAIFETPSGPNILDDFFFFLICVSILSHSLYGNAR